jgi:hypothetical protein
MKQLVECQGLGDGILEVEKEGVQQIMNKAKSVPLRKAYFIGVNTGHLSGSIFDSFREAWVGYVPIIIGYI